MDKNIQLADALSNDFLALQEKIEEMKNELKKIGNLIGWYTNLYKNTTPM